MSRMAAASGLSGRAGLWAAAAAALAVALTIASWAASTRLAPALGFKLTLLDDSSPVTTPRLERTTRGVDLEFLEADSSLPRRTFRVKWEGVWHVSEARWIDLYAGADDRIAVTLDGRLILDRSLALGMGTERARFHLAAGDHYLVVEYGQAGGGYSLNLLTGPAGGVPHPFVDEAVFPSTPGRRTLALVGAVRWLKRLAVSAWVALLLVAVAAFGGRRVAASTQRVASVWWARHHTNWHRWRTGQAAGAGEDSEHRPRRPAILVLYVLAVVAGLALFGNFYDARTGLTSLIGFGGNFRDGVIPAVRAVPHYVYENSSGYDGQFYAQLAVDPYPRSWDLVPALDSVPYRAKRILFSWSAFLLGMGRPAWVLQAYAAQNILAWLLLAALLSRWLPPVSMRHWAAWCACLFSFGLIFSVRFSLTEGPALALLALAVVAIERNRLFLAAGILGVSGLGRETTLLASPACVVPQSSARHPYVRWLVMALLLIAPMLLWLTYLRSLLGPRIWSAGGDNLTTPFLAVIAKISTTIRDLRLEGWSSPARDSALALVSLAVQGVYLVWRAEWHSAWWRAGVGYVGLAAVLNSQVWQGDPGAFVRVLLPMTVAFNVLVPASRRFWPIFIFGNLPVVTSLALMSAGLPP